MKMRPAFFAVAVLLVGILFIAKSIAPDRNAYQALLRRGTALTHAGEEGVSQVFQQNRRGVAKDFWRNQKGQRLHLTLNSVDSNLLLDQNEIVEKMQNVTCMMQEELYYLMTDGREVVKHCSGRWSLRSGDPNDPSSWITANPDDLRPMQVMRYMESDSAIYFYRQDRFIANHAKIKRFKVAGHKLPESISGLKPIMAGTAQMVELSLLNSEKKLRAHKLKATLFSSEVNL